MKRFCVCDLTLLRNGTDNVVVRKQVETLVDAGFYLLILADVPVSQREAIEQLVLEQGLAPCGLGDHGSAWVICRQNSLAHLDTGQWQASIIEYLEQIQEIEYLLVISPIECPNVHCHQARSLEEGIAMISAFA